MAKDLFCFEVCGGKYMDGYTLGPKIARGATGVVMSAFHPVRGGDIVVKTGVEIEDSELGLELDAKALYKARAGEEKSVQMSLVLEERLLARLRACPQVVQMIDSFERGPSGRFLVMERAQRTLYQEFYYRKTNLKLLIPCVHDLLRALVQMKRCGVIHRDLKPDNCLIFEQHSKSTSTTQLRLKVCDFGIAALIKPEPTIIPLRRTSGMTTIWYRAPEIALGFTDYTCAVDVWSAGCIVAELLWGRPAFQLAAKDNGNNTALIKKIVAWCGVPCEWARFFLSPIGKTCSKAFASRKGVPADAWLATLAHQMLVMDPSHRISAEKALALFEGKFASPPPHVQ